MGQLPWKTVWRFLKILKVDVLSDPANPLLAMYPKELKSESQRESCTVMLSVALVTKGKTWKCFKCPLRDE